MPLTLEELEKRLKAIEEEMAALRKELSLPQTKTPPNPPRPPEMGPPPSEHQLVCWAWERALKKMGLEGQPVGAEKLQELMAASGLKPDKNQFSQGIVEMRGE